MDLRQLVESSSQVIGLPLLLMNTDGAPITINALNEIE
jgi:hypothetical protein